MAPDLSIQLEGQLLHVPPSAQSLHHSHWMALGNIETSIVRLQALVQVMETLQQKSPPRERGREREGQRGREREREREEESTSNINVQLLEGGMPPSDQTVQTS